MRIKTICDNKKLFLYAYFRMLSIGNRIKLRFLLALCMLLRSTKFEKQTIQRNIVSNERELIAFFTFIAIHELYFCSVFDDIRENAKKINYIANIDSKNEKIFSPDTAKNVTALICPSNALTKIR